MSHVSYEHSKTIATKTILTLGAITIFEVLMALLGKGYLIHGFHLPHILVGGLMIILSVVKAYMIVYEFMHMKYEVPGLVKTVLLPTLLLVWAVIAFLAEGNYWNNSRARVKNAVQTEVISQNK
jgi:cytochrome c oxidase subunit IV